MGDPIVRLNVGGRAFDAAESTLTRSPFFVRMFDGSMAPPKLDDDGRIFIDYDPDGFAAVLRYLRMGFAIEIGQIERASFEYFGLEIREEEPEFTVEDLPGYEAIVKTLATKINIVSWSTKRAAFVPPKMTATWKTRFGFKRSGVTSSGKTFNNSDLTKALKASLDLGRFSNAFAHLRYSSGGYAPGGGEYVLEVCMTLEI